VQVHEYLGGIGFARGMATPCAFHHEERDLKAAVHGNDFTALGWGKELDWFREKMRDTFDLKNNWKTWAGPRR
jgi:hypothetical protein